MTTRATIITDASVDARAGVGGWAAWIKVDGKDAQFFSGFFGHRVGNPNSAELMAISNAVAIGVREGLLDEVDLVMIQSDNLGALAIIAKFVPSVIINNATDGGAKIELPNDDKPVRPLDAQKRAIALEVTQRITEFVQTYDLTIEVKHVKGHHGPTKPGSTGRHAINRKCDIEARRQMRAARGAFRKQESEQARAKGVRTNVE